MSDDVLLFDRLLEVAVLLQQDMAQSLTGRGLTTARTHLLWVLHRLGPSTQQALASALDVSPRNVTGLVDALEQHGYLTRRPHPRDRRAVLVDLTDAGRGTVEQMQADRLAVELALVDGLGAAQLEHLLQGLDTVISRLHAMVGDAAAAEDAR